MREAIKPLQTQQLLRPQPGQPPGPLGNKTGVQPARLGNRRQHEGVGPHQEPRQQARQRALPGTTLPVHAAQYHRGKLRHRCKTDEPDAHQRIRLPAR